jgi:TrmH family RNA methyltransferase
MRRRPRPRVRQLAGAAIAQAVSRTARTCSSCSGADDARHEEVAAGRAAGAGIAVRTATRNVIERLSNVRPAEEIRALVGRDPDADLAGSLARRGALWLLVGVAYPGNVGMVIRTAEVSGADAIAIDAPRFDHEARRAATRAAMRADKFMPVLWCGAAVVLVAARAANTGHQVFALDVSGTRGPWELDLTGPRIFVVGGENGGIPADILARADARIRVPMAGFIPCYNLQAAVSAIATERLRQLHI